MKQFTLIGLAACLVVAASIFGARTHDDAVTVTSRIVRVSGTVLGDVRATPTGASFTLGIDDGPNVLVTASGRAPVTGAHILVRGRLEPLDAARNPDEPAERDVERELGISARIAAAQILTTLGEAHDFRAMLARVRGWALDRLRAYLPDIDTAVVAGALWGERGSLPPDVRAEFQETGTVHVLVTAGLHLGIAVAVFALLLNALRVPRVVACVVAIVAAWTYAVAAGMHEPVMRAATMVTFAMCARAVGRKALSWNSLSAAAIVFALLRPRDVSGVSFALSFSCVGAILALASPIDRWIEKQVALPQRLRELIAVGFAAQLGTWPLVAAVFLQFGTYAVVANILVVPVVGAVMILGALQIVLADVAPLAQACANLNDWCVTWILAVVHGIGNAPLARISMTPPPMWCILFYDGVLVALPWLLRRGARTIAATGLAIATCFVLWPPRRYDSHLRTTMLDVGQADAIVVQTPRGHVILVDGGGQLERGWTTPEDSSAERVGERIVVPFLLRHGIHDLDAIVLSHPHGDHAGGVPVVLRHLRVAEFADGGQKYGGHAYNDALAVARERRVEMVYPRAGMHWQTDDGVTLQFIGPSLPFVTGRNAINENSVAFILEYKTFRMLFTGDAGSAAEQRFLDEGIDLHADVLKVGHHGSAYGSTPAFIDAVHPQYAIISVGRHNMFGHPAPSTLETLENAGATILRTDRNGAITVETDGQSLNSRVMLPQ